MKVRLLGDWKTPNPAPASGKICKDKYGEDLCDLEYGDNSDCPVRSDTHIDGQTR